MGKIINTSKRWPEKPEQERKLQRTRLTWEANNKVSTGYTCCEVVDYVELIQGKA
jgi:hypothetical protein